MGATVRLDLTRADLGSAGAKIEARSFGAEILVVVPEPVAVELAGTSVAGTWQPPAAGAKTRALTLSGLAFAGEVTLEGSPARAL